MIILGVLLVVGGVWLWSGGNTNSNSEESYSDDPVVSVVTIGRDTRLAIERCTQAMNPNFIAFVGLTGGTVVPAGKSTCSEARAQLAADSPPAGSAGAELLSAMANLDQALLSAGVEGYTGNYDDAAEQRLRVAIDTFHVAASAALAT